jgi:hypothetical protein
VGTASGGKAETTAFAAQSGTDAYFASTRAMDPHSQQASEPTESLVGLSPDRAGMDAAESGFPWQRVRLFQLVHTRGGHYPCGDRIIPGLAAGQRRDDRTAVDASRSLASATILRGWRLKPPTEQLVCRCRLPAQGAQACGVGRPVVVQRAVCRGVVFRPHSTPNAVTRSLTRRATPEPGRPRPSGRLELRRRCRGRRRPRARSRAGCLPYAGLPPHRRSAAARASETRRGRRRTGSKT